MKGLYGGMNTIFLAKNKYKYDESRRIILMRSFVDKIV